MGVAQHVWCRQQVLGVRRVGCPWYCAGQCLAGYKPASWLQARGCTHPATKLLSKGAKGPYLSHAVCGIPDVCCHASAGESLFVDGGQGMVAAAICWILQHDSLV